MHSAAFLIGLAIALGVLLASALARRFSVPAPVYLVLWGLAASFLPGVHDISIGPDVVFLGLLPPLIYYAGFLSSPRALRTNAVPIGLLAFGLVLATMAATAAAVHAVVPSLGWAPAFILGAVIAPTDPVAASSVFERLGAPRRIAVILEGESLLNDGIALVLYGLAVEAARTGRFSLAHGVERFVVVVVGSIAVGLAVGWIVHQLRRHVVQGSTEITLSLVTPYLVYIPADEANFSGVLATVVTGLYLGAKSEGYFGPRVRLQARAFWDVLDFLLNSVLFVLIGLELPAVARGIEGIPPRTIAVAAAVLSVSAVAIRIAWQLAMPPIVRRIARRFERDRRPVPVAERLLLGWSGLRGAISLAAALAIPVDVANRGFVLFLTFVFVYVSLVVLGSSLPWVLRALGLAAPSEGSRAESELRVAMLEAALDRADGLADEDWVPDGLLTPLRQHYEEQLRLARQRLGGDDEVESAEADVAAYERLRRELVRASRDCLNQAQRTGRIDAPTARRLRRQLDLEEVRYG